MHQEALACCMWPNESRQQSGCMSLAYAAKAMRPGVQASSIRCSAKCAARMQAAAARCRQRVPCLPNSSQLLNVVLTMPPAARPRPCPHAPLQVLKYFGLENDTEPTWMVRPPPPGAAPRLSQAHSSPGWHCGRHARAALKGLRRERAGRLRFSLLPAAGCLGHALPSRRPQTRLPHRLCPRLMACPLAAPALRQPGGQGSGPDARVLEPHAAQPLLRPAARRVQIQ